MSANCSVHLEVLAASTCARCGRFACPECLAGDDTCLSCRALERAKVMRLKPFASTAALLLITASASSIANTLASLGFKSTSMVGLFIQLGSCAMTVAAVFAVLLWFYVAMQHAQAHRAKLSVDSPGLGAVTWFVPILSMVEPFALLRQMAKSAGASVHTAIVWQVLLHLGAGARLRRVRAIGSSDAHFTAQSDSVAVASVSGTVTVLKLKWKT